MAYDLDAFCKDVHAALAADPGRAGKERVREMMREILANDAFVAEHFGPGATPGRHTLYEDPDLGFCVLAHVAKNGRVSPPHDHGTSWAIYGQAVEHTDMTVYRRVEGSGAGPAKLEEVERYRLNPTDAGIFDVGDIHRIDHPAGARFLRVTGTDLEYVPRLRFDLERRRAIEIASATVENPA